MRKMNSRVSWAAVSQRHGPFQMMKFEKRCAPGLAATSAAASLIPAGVHGTGFGVLTSASLIGMAVSPVVAGLLGSTSIRGVFIVDAATMAILALLVHRKMIEG